MDKLLKEYLLGYKLNVEGGTPQESYFPAGHA